MGGGSSGDGVYVDSNINVLLQSNEFSSCNSLWVSSYEPLATLKKIDGGEEKKDGPMFGSLINDDNAEEDSGICFNSPMKKRRLTATQAQFLEKSFEVENKLDPERKVKLAKEVGLQPRQVAIWFQNRRAQFKNKQLEKDYDSLKARFDKLKEDYDSLVKEKEGLQNEVHSLKQKLVARKKGAAVGTMNSPSTELQTPVPNTEAVSKMPMAVRVPKQEDSSSAKSEPFDSDSPQSYLDPNDSSHVFETDQYQSDFSRDEHEEKIRLGSGFFTKFYHDPPANSCSFEFPGDDDQQFWSWTC